MTHSAWVQVGTYFIALVLLVKPVGWYLARVFQNKPCGLDHVLGWLERLIYRWGGIDARKEQTWKQYAISLLLFSMLGFVALYALLRAQPLLPGGQDARYLTTPMTPELAFNTAASFVSNTNWQAYGGETTLTYVSQMLGLTVQNFLSAATGIAVLLALIRGFVRRQTETIGNFWVDLTRVALYVLLPASVILALALISQGVVQTLQPYVSVALVEPFTDPDGKPIAEQTLALGPAASQVAIKQLGTNGGGFFAVNSAHPFENPTPVSNFLEMLAILLIPGALCWTFGELVGDRRQGWVIFAAMFVILAPLVVACIWFEQAGIPQFAEWGIDPAGGNLEGKEARMRVANSGLWAAATTAASNGSVNSMHDSFTPLGGMVPLLLMQVGEVVFGGVGSGLYGMLAFVLVAVFIAGLMIGRTPEYLGKKVEAFEIKMAGLTILIPPLIVLIGAAIAVAGPGVAYVEPTSGMVRSTLTNPGAHGFSEMLYAFSSAGNNNGSAFVGLNANVPFYNVSLGLAMLTARFWLIVPVLAMAGSLARKKYVPPTDGTLPTHGPLFGALLVGIVLLVGALTFVPALALGPIVEHLQMTAR